MKDLRYLALRKDGFSDEEADWYAGRRIGGLNMRRIRRYRRRYMTEITRTEREAFLSAMDDYIADRIKPGFEVVEENIYSPEHEEMEDIEELWREQLEGTMRVGRK